MLNAKLNYNNNDDDNHSITQDDIDILTCSDTSKVGFPASTKFPNPVSLSNCDSSSSLS